MFDQRAARGNGAPEERRSDEFTRLIGRAQSHVLRVQNNVEAILRRLSHRDPAAFDRMRDALLNQELHRAIAAAGADMGNIQIFEVTSRRLKLTAHEGFKQPFVSFFQYVDTGDMACGAAQKTRRPVVVEDIKTSPLFVNAEARDVALTSGARAVRSMPLINGFGRMLGVLSVHYRHPRESNGEVDDLRAFARRAAVWIDIGQPFRWTNRGVLNNPKVG